MGVEQLVGNELSNIEAHELSVSLGNYPSLDSNWKDVASKTTIGVVNCVPLVGGLAGSTLSLMLPSRIDRIAVCLKAVSQRISDLEMNIDLMSSKVQTLLEKTVDSAGRAETVSRLAMLANCLVYGLQQDELVEIQAKAVIKLLEELDEEQILWLRSYYPEDGLDELHLPTLSDDGLTQIANEFRVNQLVGFGLLQDVEGFRSITPMGSMLIEIIGMHKNTIL